MNSVDPFNDKALRSCKGACFRIPIEEGSWEEAEKLIARCNLQKLVADLDGERPEQLPQDRSYALVLGQEGQGVSAEGAAGAMAVTIPMAGEMESLNVGVAGGILMYGLGDKG